LGGTRTPAQLADAFQVTRGAMTNTLARLEQRGCVRMQPSAADGRSKIVSITAAGKRLREQGLKQASQDLEYVLEQISASELQPALELLRRVRALLDEKRSR
ncbi:MAG: MarR family winged helix-turn-helix transcriptional regulator, partial [Pseudomonadales bacterium]